MHFELYSLWCGGISALGHGVLHSWEFTNSTRLWIETECLYSTIVEFVTQVNKSTTVKRTELLYENKVSH